MVISVALYEMSSTFQFENKRLKNKHLKNNNRRTTLSGAAQSEAGKASVTQVSLADTGPDGSLSAELGNLFLFLISNMLINHWS